MLSKLNQSKMDVQGTWVRSGLCHSHASLRINQHKSIRMAGTSWLKDISYADIRNHPKTTKNYPKLPKTTRNQLKLTITTKNHQKPPQNCQKLSKSTKNQLITTQK